MAKSCKRTLYSIYLGSISMKGPFCYEMIVQYMQYSTGFGTARVHASRVSAVVLLYIIQYIYPYEDQPLAPLPAHAPWRGPKYQILYRNAHPPTSGTSDVDRPSHPKPVLQHTTGKKRWRTRGGGTPSSQPTLARTRTKRHHPQTGGGGGGGGTRRGPGHHGAVRRLGTLATAGDPNGYELAQRLHRTAVRCVPLSTKPRT